tara:strand:- start:593 stop:943 length:351 start_codon:yes stop_codon:yes gene_type:complete
MAKKFIKLTTIRCFPNNDGQAKSKYGNSKWKPWKDGSPADIHLRSEASYSVQVYENDDGTLGINIAEVQDYESSDSIADGISQGGLKPVGAAINKKFQPAAGPVDVEGLPDDDIPF